MKPLLPTFVDFFAGSGLVTQGVKHACAPVWANDICPRKAAIYTANHGPGHFHPGSIKDGEHTRPRVFRAAPPLPGGWNQGSVSCGDPGYYHAVVSRRVSGEGAKNSTRWRMRSPQRKITRLCTPFYFPGIFPPTGLTPESGIVQMN